MYLFQDGVKRRRTARTNSMATFFESDDLMRHMFNCIEKGDQQSATLVSKGWRDVSHTMPTWRKASLYVVPMDGPHMEPRVPGLFGVSTFSLMEILDHRKHIVQFTLILASQTFGLWAELATSMPHVQWLDLFINVRDAKENDKGEMEPFRMVGLPSLTCLQLRGSLEKEASSLSLHLSALVSFRHSLDSQT